MVGWQANCYHAQLIAKEITRCFIQGRCIVHGSTGIIEGSCDLQMISIGY